MSNNANPPAATIRARVHQSALKRVTKFWASRPIEICTLFGIGRMMPQDMGWAVRRQLGARAQGA